MWDFGLQRFTRFEAKPLTDYQPLVVTLQDGGPVRRIAWLGLEGFVGVAHSVEDRFRVFSPDGRWVATGSGDHTARIWDATTGNELLTIGGHTEKVGCVAFSPDGRTVLTADNNNVVKLWDVRSLFPRE